MKPISTLADASLDFHAADAFDAVQKNPKNPKAQQYLEEAHACERELLRRQMIRNRRRLVASVRDPLTFSPFPNAPRTRRRPRALLADAWSAARTLAYLTHCRP